MEQTKSDEEIIREAAQAAERRLRELEADRMVKLAELERLNLQISRMQAVVEAAKPSRVSLTEDGPQDQGANFAGTGAIDRVLINGPMKAPEIHQALGNMYALSTLYALLNRGKKVGYYINENATWGLSEAAMRKVRAQ